MKEKEGKICKKEKIKENIWENKRKEGYNLKKNGKKSTSNFINGEKS